MINNSDIYFEAVSIKGNIGYASAYNKNGLYKINLLTGECEYIKSFDEKFTSGRLHSSVVRIKNKLFFIPGSGDKISIYDTDTDCIESIQIPRATRENYTFYNTWYKFRDAIQFGNSLWLIPSSYPGILRLDLSSLEISVYNDWIPEDGFFFRARPTLDGNSIIVPSGNNNNILVFDLKVQRAKVFKLGFSNRGMIHMMKSGADYIFVPRLPGAVLLWNPSSGAVKEYDSFPDSFVSEPIVFSHAFELNGSVFLVPGKPDIGLVLENETLKEDKKNIWKSQAGSVIEYLFESKTEYYYREIFSKNHSRFFKKKKGTGEESEYRFYIVNENEERRAMIGYAQQKGEVLYENNNTNLENLLMLIKDKK